MDGRTDPHPSRIDSEQSERLSLGLMAVPTHQPRRRGSNCSRAGSALDDDSNICRQQEPERGSRT